jgi:hypothetical protein
VSGERDDQRKAIVNLVKHGVSFDEARTVLLDPLATRQPDEDHSQTEERWNVIGRSDRSRILVVTVTPRGDTFRVISARRAMKRERHDYES